MAHVERGYKLQEIADYLDMHYASISRIVIHVEQEMLKYKTPYFRLWVARAG